MELQNGTEDLNLGQSDQDNDQVVTKMIIAFCKKPQSAKEIMDYERKDVKIKNDHGILRPKEL